MWTYGKLKIELRRLHSYGRCHPLAQNQFELWQAKFRSKFWVKRTSDSFKAIPCLCFRLCSHKIWCLVKHRQTFAGSRAPIALLWLCTLTHPEVSIQPCSSTFSTSDIRYLSLQGRLGNCCELCCLTHNQSFLWFCQQRLENEENLEKMESPLPAASKREAFVLVMDIIQKGLNYVLRHKFLTRSYQMITSPP